MAGTKNTTNDIVLEFKKHLDYIPELAWQEEKTAKYIVSKLGKPFWQKGNALAYKLGKGTTIFFRAELDALNTIEGPKHVCGHSSHMAALMGAYLYFKKNTPKNTIYFLFQPSEEGYPSGAEFITKKFLKHNHCKYGFGFHVAPWKIPGELLDYSMASGDYFEITIKGKGTHIKNKNSFINSDPLIISSKIIEQINNSHFDNTIINVGTITGGETPNSIAAKSILTGDIRAINDKGREEGYKFLKKTIEKIKKESRGINISLFYNKGYPVLINDKKLLEKMNTLFKIKTTNPTFGTEDFSLYPKPTVFLHVGTGKKENLHEVDFNVPDKVTNAIFEYWIKLGNYTF
jgi:N-acetyldiaminopimelate deacetylase